MKKLLLLLSFVFAIILCSNAQTQKSKKQPSFSTVGNVRNPTNNNPSNDAEIARKKQIDLDAQKSKTSRKIVGVKVTPKSEEVIYN